MFCEEEGRGGDFLEEVTSKLRLNMNGKGREFPRQKEHVSVEGLQVRKHGCDGLRLGRRTGREGWDIQGQRGG